MAKHRQNIPYWQQALRPYQKNYELYLMLVPVIAHYIIFEYMPIYGLQIAFRDFIPFKGFWGSPWVGFKHFLRFFRSFYFWRLIKNTFGLSLYTLAVGFPAPILLALLINEIRSKRFQRVAQNITYFPHFLSMVVVVGMIVSFTNPNYGAINVLIKFFGGDPINFMVKDSWFKTLFVFSNVWQHAGWGAIIYLAALASIDPQLYQAATVDGANRLQKIWHISLSSIIPTITILFILRVGKLLNVQFQKVLLMQNPLNMAASDVIQTYVYRIGVLEGNFSFATAVGLFNSLLNLSLLLICNRIVKLTTEHGLW